MEWVSREGWGAMAPKRVTPMLRPAAGWWLHHQAGVDRGAVSVRQIQAEHMFGRLGAADIGYSWLYSLREDRFYVGRGADVVGAHTQGQNVTSEALCVLGNWDTQEPPERLLTRVAEFGRWRGLPLLGGHRDAPGAATACPGRHLHNKIGRIRFLMQEDDGMGELSEDAQRFYQKQYELLMRQDARPTSIPTLLSHYRHVRSWFSK